METIPQAPDSVRCACVGDHPSAVELFTSCHGIRHAIHLALIVLVLCLVILYILRRDAPFMGNLIDR